MCLLYNTDDLLNFEKSEKLLALDPFQMSITKPRAPDEKNNNNNGLYSKQNHKKNLQGIKSLMIIDSKVQKSAN